MALTTGPSALFPLKIHGLKLAYYVGACQLTYSPPARPLFTFPFYVQYSIFSFLPDLFEISNFPPSPVPKLQLNSFRCTNNKPKTNQSNLTNPSLYCTTYPSIIYFFLLVRRRYFSSQHFSYSGNLIRNVICFFFGGETTYSLIYLPRVELPGDFFRRKTVLSW